MTQRPDSFGSRGRLRAGSREYDLFRLDALERAGFGIARLPFSIKVLLESLLHHEDGRAVTADDVRALASWSPTSAPEREIAFQPARVLMQDLTGVPAVVDLAAMRDAVQDLGGDPAAVNPLQPADLIIDHSVQVDDYGHPSALGFNVAKEYERNSERYQFLRWGQQAFHNFSVVPPGAGICHQVNLEHLGRVVFAREEDGRQVAFCDTLVGTDSHTTMINALGILGWGVGGIEAEAAMLGQPISMLIPEVIGVRLHGELAEGATGTDVVLAVTEMLRRRGVVGKFVEFYGSGLSSLSVPERATIANMAPEYGATCGFFPVDHSTLDYLRLTGRSEDLVQLVEAYCKEQGLFRTDSTPDPRFSDTLGLDLGTVVPSIAGPRRPQDRVPLSHSKVAFRRAVVELTAMKSSGIDAARLEAWVEEGGALSAEELKEIGMAGTLVRHADGREYRIRHGSVAIAAITSCTNTSNPDVMIGAGILARKALERGLERKPWVKTSLAPGSKVVMDYLRDAGLSDPLEKLGFALVGYGCTTCIGNSGPLDEPVADAIDRDKLVAVAVLSGNRNFEGRIHPSVRANYLASPPLVVAYALAGTMDIDFQREPLGTDRDGGPVYLRDIWPTPREVAAEVSRHIRSEMFREEYGTVYDGDERWRALRVPAGRRYEWDAASAYIRRAPYFDNMPLQPPPPRDVAGARVLALLGDSVTTDHISPAGSIKVGGPAARYLEEHGVRPPDYNSYGSRRGNHEVMVRGTFANIRLRNLLASGTEGGVTIHLPGGEQMAIYEAAMRYRDEGVPLLVIAGKEYGTGSSRDWAAKGTLLLGVRAVIAESFERIHRSNLVGMGVLPLQFLPGQSASSLGLTGRERYDIAGIAEHLEPRSKLRVRATADDGTVREFDTLLRIDTPVEVDYYRHGGILPYVLRQLLARGAAAAAPA